MNSIWESLESVERHLLIVGIYPLYVNWVYRGEQVNLPKGLERVSTHLHHNDEGTSNLYEQGEMLDFLDDLQVRLKMKKKQKKNLRMKFPLTVINVIQQTYLRYLGCSKFSSLNFLVKLMHIKVINSWSNKSFDMLLARTIKSSVSTRYHYTYFIL